MPQMLVLLGEVGGADEYDVCDALKSGRITKPLVAWCIGTCASIFPFEVRKSPNIDLPSPWYRLGCTERAFCWER